MSDEVQQQEFVYDEEADVFRGTENAEYTISGEDAGGFFLRKMVENGQSWTMTASSSMSDKMKTYITELSTQYATKRFTFNNIVFLYDSSEDTFKCRIVYRAATAPRNRTDIFNARRCNPRDTGLCRSGKYCCRNQLWAVQRTGRFDESPVSAVCRIS